jgi:hypothetical protein
MDGLRGAVSELGFHRAQLRGYAGGHDPGRHDGQAMPK